MKLINNKILITGGGSGIGLGLTERFLAEKNTVLVCGRREDVLQQLSDRYPSVITKVCDVADEEERTRLFDWIKEDHPDVNVLVNNAGIQQWMNVTDDNFYQRAKQEIQINVEAPLHLVSLFLQLPSFNTVMNVTSGLAFSPLSKVPVYCATKAFLRSFTLSLRYQLQQRNIEVIEIIPPALNTDLGGKGLHDAHPPVGDFINAIFEQLQEGKQELTFGFSELMVNAGPQELRAAFHRMNPA